MICPKCCGCMVVVVGEERDGYMATATCEECGHTICIDGCDDLPTAVRLLEMCSA